MWCLEYLVSILLTLTYFPPCSSVSIVNFEHVIAGLHGKIQIEENNTINNALFSTNQIELFFNNSNNITIS